MKDNELRLPLIKSAVVLLTVILLFAFAASSPGSMWSQLGGIFVGIFTTIQLAIGLLVAVFFSIVVLVGIFLAAVAGFSKPSAERMYRDLRIQLAQMLPFLSSVLLPAEADAAKGKVSRAMISDLAAAMERRFAALERRLDKADADAANSAEQTKGLAVILMGLQNDLRTLSSGLDHSSKALDEAKAAGAQSGERLAKLDDAVAKLRTGVETVNASVDSGIAALNARVVALDKAVAEAGNLDKLNADIETLRQAMVAGKETLRKELSERVEELKAGSADLAATVEQVKQDLTTISDNAAKANPTASKERQQAQARKKMR